jgi:nucleoside-diphosphate-sugar epimerase
MQSQASRFKDLRYSNARLRDRLDWRPERNLAEALRAAAAEAAR